MNKKIYILVFSIIFFTAFTHSQVSSINQETISLDINNRHLSAIFSISSETNLPAPGVIVFHGFSANKEMMRPFTEALAERGFAVLTVDQQGHGSSSGKLGEDGEFSLRDDGLALVKYLRGRSEVNSSSIGVLGHSMGAGTSIQIALKDPSIRSSVIIGNDLQDVFVNTTNPQNLMMAIGSIEEIFSVEEALNTMERAVGRRVEVATTYGQFEDGNARRIIIPTTDHIFEVGNPDIISESIDWLRLSLGSNSPSTTSVGIEMMIRAFVSLISGILWFWMIPTYLENTSKTQYDQGESNNLVFHGIILVFSFLLGAAFIGLGLFWVFIGWFMIGSLVFIMKYRRSDKWERVKQLMNSDYKLAIVRGLIAITLIFIPLQVLFHLVTWDMRYVLPFFSELSISRLGLMIVLWIPGTIFFTLETLNQGSRGSVMKDSFSLFLARTWPFIVILLIQYIPLIITGKSIFPGIFGILSFFVVAMIPIMIILSILSSFALSYQVHPITSGIIIGGYISWALASTLPIIA